MATPDKRRNRRQKATTQLGRTIMQEQRQILAAEQAAIAEQMVREARAVHDAQRPVNMPPKEQVAINRSIVRRVSAVLASEHVVVPIRCEQASAQQNMSAWTDFTKIYVRYQSQADKRVLAANIRGLLYHEGGHCRWTVPFLELASLAGVNGEDHRHLHRAWNVLEDQRMETAVVSDSPRKAAYLTPMVMTTHMASIDIMVANYPLLVWRRYIPRRLRDEARRLFVLNHNLDGKDGEMLARALDAVTTSYVTATDATTMWNAVGAMALLLEQCRPLACYWDDSQAGHNEQGRRPLKLKEAADDFDGLTIPISPDMLPDAADGDEDVPEAPEPRDLNDLSDQDVEHIMEILAASLLSPETLVSIRYVVNMPQEAGEGGSGAGDLADEQDDKAPADFQPESLVDEDVDDEGGNADDQEAKAEDDDGQAGGEGDDEDQDADQQHGKADDEAADEQEVEDSGSSRGAHSGDGSDARPIDQQELDQALQEAEAERDSQSDLDGDMRAWSDVEDNPVTDLDTYVGGVSDNAAAEAEADRLAYEIEQAFHEHTMDRAPSWVEQQRRGVLNVQRYVTRQPGDTEVFRQWTEDDAPGYDIAVSVLLDYSGSMQRHATRLAQSGFACKVACQNLDIPCTVTLWDTEARTLWDAEERAEYLPVIQCTGGTVPDMALADLDKQRCERSKHLVLIMTDGQWQGRWAGGDGTLAWYKDEGRSIVGFGYGNEGLARNMLRRGCDDAFSIDDLMEIPRRLESFLLDAV
jgi:hypothetical protein